MLWSSAQRNLHRDTPVRIFCLADEASGWCPAVILDQYRQASRHTMVTDPAQADLIWIHSYYLLDQRLLSPASRLAAYLPLPLQRRADLRRIPIVTTLHHLSPQKKAYWQPLMRRISSLADAWHVPSPRSVTAGAAYLAKPIVQLPYWIDRGIFYPLPDATRRTLRQRYQVPTGALVIGSFQRDTEGDGITPKVEKGPDIFCDIVERLPHATLFVMLSGPRRQYVERRLARAGIRFRNVGNVPFTEMNNLYNLLDYYLVTSRHEGGPQAILEAAATNTKIYSTPVGIAADILSREVIVSNTANFITRLSKPYPNVLEHHLKRAHDYSRERIIPRYDDYFEQLAAGYVPKSRYASANVFSPNPPLS